MHVDLLLDRRTLRWHVQFIRACEAASFDVAPIVVAESGADLGALDLLLGFEKVIYRARPCAFERAQIEGKPATNSDVDVDISGAVGNEPRRLEGRLRLRPLYDGSPDPAAAVSALLERRAPKISVELADAQGARIVSRGIAAVRDPRILSQGLDETFAQVTSLLLRALQELRAGLSLPKLSSDAATPFSHALVGFAAGSLAGKAAGFLTHLLRNPEHWRVAFRYVGEGDVLERLQWSEAPWRILPDDGRRFYADPFVIVRNGQTHLFVEEFPYATGKGIISHCVIGANGETSTPTGVLETDGHMSYPFVFERGDQIYMIPETGAAGHIALYRATRFPERWALDRVLIADVEAYDATLLEHDGRLWLFAAMGGHGASTHDALGIFYADDLFGPWRRHPRNPVVVDPRMARPAGAFASRNGRLLRLAQDCVGGYGLGIVFCQVDKLDQENYEQTIVKRLGPPACLQGEGAHTFNRGGGVEVIDFKQPVSRFGAARLAPGGKRGDKARQASSGNSTAPLDRERA